MSLPKAVSQVCYGDYSWATPFSLALWTSGDLLLRVSHLSIWGVGMWPPAYLALTLPRKKRTKVSIEWMKSQDKYVVKQCNVWYSSRIRCFSHVVALKAWKEALKEGVGFWRGTQIKNEQNYLVFQLIHIDGKVNLLLVQWLYFTFCIMHLATLCWKKFKKEKKRKILLQRKRCYTGCLKRGNTPVNEVWGMSCAC